MNYIPNKNFRFNQCLECDHIKICGKMGFANEDEENCPYFDGWNVIFMEGANHANGELPPLFTPVLICMEDAIFPDFHKAFLNPDGYWVCENGRTYSVDNPTITTWRYITHQNI